MSNQTFPSRKLAATSPKPPLLRALKVRVMGEFFQPKVEGDSFETARLLTEVDHLNQSRQWDGSLDPYTLSQVHVNLTPGVQEAAQPYAITPTFREKKGNDYYWNGQTVQQTARSGRHWYTSAEAQPRQYVEEDEADDACTNLQPGDLKILISPKMTRQDAPLEVAKREHLADDDAVRVTGLVEKDGQVVGMKLDSLLIRDIPLSAWIAMANDPHGLFEGRVQIPEEDSALPIMQAHRAMHLPAEKLPNGPLSVVEAVVPYIQDHAAREKAEWHVAMFRSVNQQKEYANAENIARRWLDFEVELADSLHYGYATPAIHDFIASVDGRFKPEVQDLIIELSESGELEMTRELAAHLEAVRRKTLWTSAAVLSGNEEVLAQLPHEVAEQIRTNEQFLQIAQSSGYSTEELRQLEAQNNSLIARRNIAVGRGCSVTAKDGVNDDPSKPFDSSDNLGNEGTEDNEQSPTFGVIRCVKCRQYVRKEDVVKIDCWQCPKCQHKVDVCTGDVLREGETPAMKEGAKRTLQPFAIDGLARMVRQSKNEKEAKQPEHANA